MSILLLGAGLGATQTRLLDYVPGAAAAYSLRQVGRQYNGPVVRVRRASDNTERNFNASEIDNGTLVSWVNSTPALPLDQASGAAAAYSLRNLSSSYSGNVIRARRASDNDERDFTASEIIDGTLTTWTNATVALPLDQASGAAAAYSLRNLSASYTGDVVRVRRSGDNSESDFTATEVSDGTLASWVTAGGGTEDGFVDTWYDQSGNDRHATQATTAKQPQIVDSGSLVTEGGKAALEFDGSNDYISSLSLASVFSGSDKTTSTFCVRNDSSTNGGTLWNAGSSDSNSPLYLVDVSAGLIRCWARNDINQSMTILTTPLSGPTISAAFFAPSSQQFFVNGAFIGSNTFSFGQLTLTEFAIGIMVRTTAYSAPLDGTISEIIVYPSDQSANRTAIEANLAEFYGIDLPEGVDAGNDEVDAFVTTWYDQSGNDRHAVQSTAVSQPKIVSDGSLITENGKAALEFDGSDDRLVVTGYKPSSLVGLFSLFTYSSLTSVDLPFSFHKVGATSGGVSFFNYTPGPTKIALQTGLGGVWVDGVSALALGDFDLSQSLICIQIATSTTTLHYRGVQLLNSNKGAIAAGNDLTIGGNAVSPGSNSFDGNFQELIIYPSDQTANRERIEGDLAWYY